VDYIHVIEVVLFCCLLDCLLCSINGMERFFWASGSLFTGGFLQSADNISITNKIHQFDFLPVCLGDLHFRSRHPLLNSNDA
jgi:hypothetical protein